MSSKATGASRSLNGDTTKSRTNKSTGDQSSSSGRAFTVEQKSAVVRVRKCSPTAFYDILGLEATRTTCSDGEIKKAYRKLSLLTHPDKNGYQGADEAFKMISRAFQILSDAVKRSKYDRYGIDSDTRGAAPSTPSFARSQGGGGGGMRGGMFEEEISPEDIFRQFFGGGGGMGGPAGPFGGSFGGLFDTGPNFVFNMGGGGPGVRIHQFGGNRPRRRAQENNPNVPPTSTLASLQALLPLALLFLIPLLSSLFDSFFSGPTGPQVRFNSPIPPQTEHHVSHRFEVDYYVDPSQVQDYSASKWKELDVSAEVQYINLLQNECEERLERKRNLQRQAYGIFWTDQALLDRANSLDLASCQKLDKWGIGRRRL